MKKTVLHCKSAVKYSFTMTWLILIILIYTSCLSVPAVQNNPENNTRTETGSYPEGNSYRSSADITKPLTSEEQKLLVSVENLMGKPPGSKVTVNGRTFTLDCIGTVCAVYYQLSLDLTKDFSRYPGNGVKRLYASLKEKNVLHRDRYPRPGDIVFWDNTWDANEDNNKNNDPLTHAGVVIRVDDDGTIYYIHSHIKRGIVVEVMNLIRPGDYYGENGKVINNALALGSGISRPVNPDRWLSGDLLNSLADAISAGKYYRMGLSNDKEVLITLEK